jgi:hypothetical protein
MGTVIRPRRLWTVFRFIRLPLLIAICGGLSGCGALFNSIYRSEEVGKQNLLITTDAQQRVILRENRVGRDGEIITCVEPHPDAFTVNAASAAGNFTAPNGLGAALSGASSQAGASLALRTQTNTILREQGYRICEAYVNGAVSKLDYAQLLRRNQVMVTAVLAIEQLTGAVVGPSFAIGASSSAEVDKDAVAKLKEDITKKETEIDQLTPEATNKQADAEKAKKAVKDQDDKIEQMKKDPTTKPADLAAANTTLSGLVETQKKAEDMSKAATDKLKAAKLDLITMKQNLLFAQHPELKTSTQSDLHGAVVLNKDISEVAMAVQHIVDRAFDKAYIFDLCQMYWAEDIQPDFINKMNAGDVKFERLGKVCDKVFEIWAKVAEHQGVGKVDFDNAGNLRKGGDVDNAGDMRAQ